MAAGNEVGLLRDRTAGTAAARLNRNSQMPTPTITTTTAARADARSRNTDCSRHKGCRARRLIGAVKIGVYGVRFGVWFGVRLDGRLGAAAIGTALGPSERNMSSAPDS